MSEIVEAAAPGVEFGLLTALKEVDPGRWRCRCRCGAKVEVLAKHLLSGRVASCGCALRKATQRDRLLEMLKAGPVDTGKLCAAFPGGHGHLLAQLEEAGHRIGRRPVRKGRRGMAFVWEYRLSL